MEASNALGPRRPGSGLPGRSGRIAGKPQAAQQQVNKRGRPEEEHELLLVDQSASERCDEKS
jgi:hypothetical protein